VFIEEGRSVKTMEEAGSVSSVKLMTPNIDQETGEVIFENDLSNAKFDVAVDVGPTSSSKKAATVRALTGMMQVAQDPETLQVLGAMAMMNMEGEGIADVRSFFRRRLVNMGVVRPTEEEMLQMQEQAANAQPDPQTQYMMAAAEQASAEAAKARADTVWTVAKAEETQAKTMKTISEIDEIDQRQALQVIDRFGAALQPQQQQPQQGQPLM
jgi:hypothetical protein